MALQSTVELYTSPAVPGQKATPTQSVYTPVNYLAGEGGVAAGGFAFASDVERIAKASGSVLLGFVERVISTSIYDETVSGTLVVPEHDGLTIAVRGDYWVKAPAAVSVGDAVYCDTSTGAVAESGTDTGWTYATSAAADEMAIITNWAASATASSSGNDNP